MLYLLLHQLINKVKGNPGLPYHIVSLNNVYIVIAIYLL